MSTLNAYVFFDGDCAEAVRFYERTLGATTQMMMKAKDSPMPPQNPADGERILHAHIQVDGKSLLLSDWMAPHPFPGRHGFALALQYDSVEQAKRVFAALADGGTVNMPMQKTFWSESFGMLADRFGIHWMVGGPQLAV